MYMESEGKWSENYFKTVVTVEMNPIDVRRLGARDRVKIARDGYSLVALVKPVIGFRRAQYSYQWVLRLTF